MTPEELAIFRAGEARRSAKIATEKGLDVSSNKSNEGEYHPIGSADYIPKPRDLKAEEEAQSEYYRLEEAGQLPLGRDGKSMDVVDFMFERLGATAPLTPETLTSVIGEPGETSLPADATYGEVKARLRTLREKLAGITPNENDPKLPTLSAKELYELRVETMASKHGMQDMFERVRVVREEYLEARALAHQRGYAQDNIGDLKKTYDNTLFYWRNDLTRKAESFAGKERAELLIAAKRDTILGPAQVEIEARERALTEKGKTALGKAEIWLTQTPQLALKGLNFIPNAIGSGIAQIRHGGEKVRTPEESRAWAAMTPKQRELHQSMIVQDYARKYARNVRILAGAGIATFLAVSATPVSLGSGALAFAVYTARGVLGTAAGVGGAKAAGWGFNFFNKNKRQELKDWTSKVPSTLEEYQAQQAAYMRGNSKKRSQEKMGWQMVAAMLTGAGVGAVSSPLAHEFLEHIGALSSVKEAAQSVADVNAHSPGAGAEAMKLSAALKHSSESSHLTGGNFDAHQAAPEHLNGGHPTAPHAVGSERIPAQTSEAYSVEIKPGEGMDKLFVELREHYGKLYPDPTDPSVPPGIRHLLEAKSGDELSRELHFINHDNASYVMKQGDSLGFNEHGALVFTPKGDPTHSLELFTTDSKGTFTPHALTPEEQQGHFLNHPDAVRSAPIHHETPRVAEAQTPMAHTETPDEVTARLNTEGRYGHPVPPSEAPANTDAPVSQADVASTGDTSMRHDASDAAPAPASEHAHPVPPPAAAPAEHSPVTPSTDTADAPATAEVAPGVGEAFINPNNVPVAPAETHLYTVGDASAPEGQQLVVFGGGDPTKEGFLERVQELAREHPGRKVYFDAGYPVDYNGAMRRWINSVVFDPKGGITMGVTPEGPEMIGVINPNTFISRVN